MYEHIYIHIYILINTECAGWAVTAGIPVKFVNAHGRSTPEVASTKCIDVYGNRGIYRPYLVIWYSQLKMTPLSDIL